tara:strand:+ start:2123 stop:2935 length:813 start_codon:yes stop_codon:yes gene_type:complete
LANEFYNNILQRLPATLILVTFIFGTLYLQNTFIVFVLILGVGFLLIKEWLALSDSRVDLIHIIFFIAPIILSLYFREGFINFYLLLGLIFWIIYSFFLIFNKTSSLISFNNNYLGIFLILVFLLGLTHLVMFSKFPGFNNFFVLFLVLFNTVLVDVGAYLIGSSMGKTPLFPQVSPNKTIEGFLGGIGFVLVFLATIYLYGFISLDLLIIFLFSAPFAFIGDYLESQLKREKLVKDSGSLIPGHGGVWDRLDSHISVVPIFILLTILVL